MIVSLPIGVEGGFSADNQDEENNFEIVADLLEESDFQIEKEDNLNKFHLCTQNIIHS